MNLMKFIRALRPVDLLLPAGAALVSAGLQNLADREHRQRARLDELAQLVDVHRGALVAAGVDLAAELLVDEPHPLDPAGGALTDYASDDYRIADNHNPEKPRGFSGWRRFRRAAFIGAVGLGTFGLSLRYLQNQAHPAGPPVALGEASNGEYARLVELAEDVKADAAAEDLSDVEAAAGRCWWPGCDYENPHPATLALHRNDCGYRPANAKLPGA